MNVNEVEKEIEITFKWNSYNESNKVLDSVIKFNFIRAESVLAKGVNSTTSFANNTALTRSNIESITFMPTIDVPDGTIEVWDASLTMNGSVMAYTMDSDSDNLYELYIGGYGEIKLSEASFLFYAFTNMTSIDFNDIVTTTNVTNMALFDLFHTLYFHYYIFYFPNLLNLLVHYLSLLL